MAVTELAILKAVTPGAVQTPSVQAFLRTVAEQQAARSGFPVLYYHPITSDPSGDADTVYLLSGWDSVAAHDVWIASAANQALLKEMNGVFALAGFHHLDVDFGALPRDEARWITWDVTPQGQARACDSGSGDSARASASGAVLWEGFGSVLDSGTQEEHRIRVLNDNLDVTDDRRAREGQGEGAADGARVVFLKKLTLASGE